MSILLLSALLGAAPVEPPGDPARIEAQVPLAQFRLRRFRVLGDDVVYLQGRRRQWYRATLVEPCYPLRGAMAIGLDTRGSATLDRDGAIIVRGERCPIHSLVASGPPPRRAR